MGVFGPWFPPLVVLGALLLAGGLAARRAASVPFVRGIGRYATKGGSLMLLFAATMYLLILALVAVFEGMLSNLPGA